MSTMTLTFAPAQPREDARFVHTPQISDAAYFSWLDAFCGDAFNRVVVRIFGPA